MLVFILLYIYELAQLVWEVFGQRETLIWAAMSTCGFKHLFVSWLWASGAVRPSLWERCSWDAFQTFIEHLLCTKPVCAQVYEHRLNCPQGIIDSVQVEKTVVTGVKHGTRTFWHFSHWEMRSVSSCIWMGLWLLGPIEHVEMTLHDFQGFKG